MWRHCVDVGTRSEAAGQEVLLLRISMPMHAGSKAHIMGCLSSYNTLAEDSRLKAGSCLTMHLRLTAGPTLVAPQEPTIESIPLHGNYTTFKLQGVHEGVLKASSHLWQYTVLIC